MSSITIDSDDPRSLRAIQLAAEMPQWLRCRTIDGELRFGIPSQRSPGLYHLASEHKCTCEDNRRNGLRRTRISDDGEHTLCKHVRAVRLQAILLSVDYAAAQPRLRRVK
jgi:hypothetical protein